MQISLPDDPRFQANATAAGYASVEAYVLVMLRKGTGTPGSTEPVAADEQHASHDQWKREFHAFQKSLRPCNPQADDTRESIYPVRGQ